MAVVFIFLVINIKKIKMSEIAADSKKKRPRREFESEPESDDTSRRRAQLLGMALYHAKMIEDHERELENIGTELTRSERLAARSCASAVREIREVLKRRERDAVKQTELEEVMSGVGNLGVVWDVLVGRIVPMLADDGPALAHLCATSKACKSLVEMTGVLPHRDVRAFCSKHATATTATPRRHRLFSKASVFVLAVREKDHAHGNPNFETLRFACERWGDDKPLSQEVFETYMNNAYRMHERLEEVEWLLANTNFSCTTTACQLVVKRLAYFMPTVDETTVARVVDFLKHRVQPLTSKHRILNDAFREFLEENSRLAPVLQWAREVENKKK